MEEIEQLLAKLKKDQEVLYDDFKEQVLRAYSGQQKKYAHKDFEVLNEIVCRHFGIPTIFVQTRKIYYVAARSVFDFILRNNGHTLGFIGSETNREHTTIINSLKIYEGFSKDVSYKDLYLEIKNEFNNYKL